MLFDFQEQAIINSLNLLQRAESISLALTDPNLDPYQLSWKSLGYDKDYSSFKVNNEFVPNVCVSIPTGGGKTLIGLKIVGELIQSHFLNTNLVLWFVPNEALYNQLITRLSDPDYYSVFNFFGKKQCHIKTYNSTFSDSDFAEDSFCLLILTNQSVMRSKNKENLRIYKPREEIANLSFFDAMESTPSLISLLTSKNPIVVIDEAHKTYTNIARTVLEKINPCYVLELTATPKGIANGDNLFSPNIIFSATSDDLISNSLVKKKIEYCSFTNTAIDELLEKAAEHQVQLKKLFSDASINLLPKVLISTEFTSEEFSNHESSVGYVKDRLISLGVNSDKIALKTSSVDQIKNLDLDDETIEIEYVITKSALQEGWDCKSVYTIVLINNVSAPISNFQILGRGLRQPYLAYFYNDLLNKLYIYTNSKKHEDSISQLKSFLEDNGFNEYFVNDAKSVDLMQHEFLLENKSYCAKIPQLFIVDEEKYKKSLKHYSIKEGAKILPFQISQLELDKSKGVIHTSLSLSSPKYSSWQFIEVPEPSVKSKEQVALAIANSILEFFRTVQESFDFSVKQVDSLLDEGLDLVFITNNLHSLTRSVKLLFEDYCLDMEISHFLQHIKAGGIRISDYFELPAIINLPFQPSEGFGNFNNNIYGNIPLYDFNNQEREFAYFLESFKCVKWLRNNVHEVGVYYQAPFGKVYPDFFVFNLEKGSMFTVVIETKGSHLKDSIDTKRKSMLFEALSQISSSKHHFILGNFEYCKKTLKTLLNN